jgi:hypothetical protein
MNQWVSTMYVVCYAQTVSDDTKIKQKWPGTAVEY